MKKLIIQQCNELLASLQIPTETQVEKKAALMKSLGFSDSNVVIKQSTELSREKEVLQEKKTSAEAQLQEFKRLKDKYPHNKFLTVAEFERICEKYNLVYAPANCYIQDIPEKNLLEIKNSIALENVDKSNTVYILEEIKPISSHTDKYKGFLQTLVGKELNTDSLYQNNGVTTVTEESIAQLVKGTKFENESERNQNSSLAGRFYFNTAIITEINKSGLQIAAPISHFDLSSVSKTNKFGYATVNKRIVLDPIAFEFCGKDMVRILSKWGTSDDQSYLDPSLTNENLN